MRIERLILAKLNLNFSKLRSLHWQDEQKSHFEFDKKMQA